MFQSISPDHEPGKLPLVLAQLSSFTGSVTTA